jgi:hypothetical protein
MKLFPDLHELKDTPPPEAEVLIEEARQRQRRRRRLLTAGAVVLLAGLGGGIHALSSRSSSPPSAGSSRARGARTGVASTGKVTPDQPIALAVSRDGDLYIGDRGRNEILEWVSSGRFRIVAETHYPDSLLIAPNGTLYFTQAGRYLGPTSSSGGMLNTVIQEITPTGTIRTIAGLHPSCPSGAVRSVPAESALFYGAPLSLSAGGALVVDANLCIKGSHGQRFGPTLLLTSSGRFIQDTSNPVPAVASIDCGSGVPGPGFHVFGCMSGGGDTANGHPRELLVVRSDGSSVAYPDHEGLDFAVGDGEVVATYDGNLVRVTSSRLVPLLTNQELQSDLRLRIRAVADIGAPTVGADGDIYFVASIIQSGCQNRILERTTGGALRQIWGSSVSRSDTCF